MPAPHLALALINVIYVGVAGPSNAPAGRELGALLTKEAHVETINTSDRNRRKLVSAGSAAHSLVMALDSGGIVAGEIAGDDSPILRVVVFDGQANLKLQLDVPLARDMSFDTTGFDMVHQQIVPAVNALRRKAPAHAPVPEPDSGDDNPGDHPGGDHPGGDHPSGGDDGTSEEPGPVATGDDDAAAKVAGEPPPLVTVTPGLHAIAELGFGVMARSFQPSPAAIAAYDSSPVGAVNLSGELRPERHVALLFLVERSLPMSTRLHGAILPTWMMRWQFSLAARLPIKRLALDGEVGLGTRTFTIDSKDPSRSPDGNYNYLVIGARARRALGRRAELGGFFGFEPVLSGEQATSAAFGNARRFAVDARASLRWVVASPVLLEASGSWQRFFWAWPSAGGRSGGSASDDYFTGSVAIGAQL